MKPASPAPPETGELNVAAVLPTRPGGHWWFLTWDDASADDALRTVARHYAAGEMSPQAAAALVRQMKGGWAVNEDELRERVAVLERLVEALGDKLLTLAEHLGRLAERREVRRD